MDAVTSIDQVTISAVVVWILQLAKRATWVPWIKAGAAKANRIASAILACLGAAGLHWQWTAATHTLIISNLTLAVVAMALWTWLQHFVLQETIYQATANRSDGGNGNAKNSPAPVSPTGPAGTH